MSKEPPASPWLALIAVAAYCLRFGSSWLMLQRVPPARFDPHGFGLLGDALELAVLAVPLGALLWWILWRRGPWRGLLAPAASPGRTLLSVLLLLLLGAPKLGQVWTMILLPLSECWPVVLSALLWFAVAALLRALAASGPGPTRRARSAADARPARPQQARC